MLVKFDTIRGVACTECMDLAQYNFDTQTPCYIPFGISMTKIVILNCTEKDPTQFLKKKNLCKGPPFVSLNTSQISFGPIQGVNFNPEISSCCQYFQAQPQVNFKSISNSIKTEVSFISI